jgi:hypothetical protein
MCALHMAVRVEAFGSLSHTPYKRTVYVRTYLSLLNRGDVVQQGLVPLKPVRLVERG